MPNELNFLSLSEQVYNYLRKQMNDGQLAPGSAINIGEIAKQLGVSKTPLRDALIQLELEGFVSILPRRGVKVNELEIRDVKNAYDAIGLIEGHIVETCFQKINAVHITRLEKLNNTLYNDIMKDDFSRLFKTNLQFHSVYLDISDNELVKKFIVPIKHRLYDFPCKNFIKDWELRNCEEHNEFINRLKSGDAAGAAHVLRDVHWSFEVQKDYIYSFYGTNDEE